MEVDGRDEWQQAIHSRLGVSDNMTLPVTSPTTLADVLMNNNQHNVTSVTQRCCQLLHCFTTVC